jgi:hypothetical protein
MDRLESGCEIDLDDVLGDGVEDVLLALAHPIPELGEVDLVGATLLLLEILVEDDLQVLQVVEDVVEGVADH